MIHFFVNPSRTVYDVQTQNDLSVEDISRLNWQFRSAKKLDEHTSTNSYVSPRAAMVNPCITNADEIIQYMDIQCIIRTEEFYPVHDDFTDFDPVISQKYTALTQDIYTINI